MVEVADMGARRELGHHTAIRRVLVELAAHDIGEDAALAGGRAVRDALDDRRRGLVATGLDAQKPHCLGNPESLRRAGLAYRGEAGFAICAIPEDRQPRLGAGLGPGAARAGPAGQGAWRAS